MLILYYLPHNVFIYLYLDRIIVGINIILCNLVNLNVSKRTLFYFARKFVLFNLYNDIIIIYELVKSAHEIRLNLYYIYINI